MPPRSSKGFGSELRAELRQLDRAKLRELAERVRQLAAEKRVKVEELREHCKREIVRLRAERDKQIAKLRKEYREARRASIEAHGAAKHERRWAARYGVRRSTGIRVRLPAESDDEVRSNIEPRLWPLWDRVRRGIKETPRMSRTEAFLHYAHDHPHEALESAQDEIALQEADYERQYREHLRDTKHPRRYSREPAELAHSIHTHGR